MPSRDDAAVSPGVRHDAPELLLVRTVRQQLIPAWIAEWHQATGGRKVTDAQVRYWFSWSQIWVHRLLILLLARPTVSFQARDIDWLWVDWTGVKPRYDPLEFTLLYANRLRRTTDPVRPSDTLLDSAIALLNEQLQSCSDTVELQPLLDQQPVDNEPPQVAFPIPAIGLIRLLGAVHEDLSGCTLQRPRKPGGKWSVRANPAQRRTQGTFYTPQPIVEQLVRDTLEAPLAARIAAVGDPLNWHAVVEDLTILDPAVGCGHFLIAAAQYIVETLVAHGTPTKDRPAVLLALANWCLHGLDVDPVAVMLARWGIALSSGCRPAKLFHSCHFLQTADSLLGLTPHDPTPRPETTSPKQIAAFFKELVGCRVQDPFHWSYYFPHIFCRGGFAIILGNPPYGVLPAKSSNPAEQALRACVSHLPSYAAVGGGKLNLYQLFIARCAHLLQPGGQLGLLVPLVLLGDRDVAPLRKWLIEHFQWKQIRVFAEHLTVGERVFATASQSTCSIVLRNEHPAADAVLPVSLSTDPSTPPLQVQVTALRQLDPDQLAIPQCSAAEWQIVNEIWQRPWIEPLGTGHRVYEGEINETTDRPWLLPVTHGPAILRGANINRYTLRPAWKSTDWQLDPARAATKLIGHKQHHHKELRIGLQRSAPKNNYRRLIATLIPPGNRCFDTVAYLVAGDCALSPLRLLALLNSRLLDWYFDWGSSNSKINAYRVHQLPVPRFEPPTPDSQLPATVTTDDLLNCGLEALSGLTTASPALPAIVGEILERLTTELCRLEGSRQVHTLRARSQLDVNSEAVQQCADRLIAACYGLSAEQAKLASRRTQHGESVIRQ